MGKSKNFSVENFCCSLRLLSSEKKIKGTEKNNSLKKKTKSFGFEERQKFNKVFFNNKKLNKKIQIRNSDEHFG